MPLPSGVSALPSAVRIHFDPTGAPAALHIDYHLLNAASGAVIGGGTRTVTPDGPTAVDSFQGDGKETAFTTRQAAYPGGLFAVRVAGVPVASGWTQATNPNGSVTVTFATAPAAGTAVQIAYSTGPGLSGQAGDLATALESLGAVGPPSGMVELSTIACCWAQSFVQDH